MFPQQKHFARILSALCKIIPKMNGTYILLIRCAFRLNCNKNLRRTVLPSITKTRVDRGL